MVSPSLGKTFESAKIWGITATAFCLWIGGPFSVTQKHSAIRTAAPATARPDVVFVQTPEMASGTLAGRFPKGSVIVRLSATAAKNDPVRLTDEFFAAADPQINFEGTKVLFSGQKNRGERWQIWEMDLDGSHKRQVTQCNEDCVRGVYLPADEVALTVEERQRRESYIAVVKSDGSQLRRITFGPAQYELETVLRDGRIVAAAPWPLNGGKKSGSSRQLYTLRPDGTALESFRCEHREAGLMGDAEEMEDGSLVYVTRAGTGAQAGGKLEQIRRGAAGSSALGTGPGVYRTPRQLSAEELIVAKEETARKGVPGKFDLYILRVKSGTLGERVYADARQSSIQPAVVAAHAVPKRYWSTLNPGSQDGYFISLNSYLSQDAAKGRLATKIAQVRVMTVNAADGKEESLGQAPVESDGSFYVRVPANAPVRFVLLDEKSLVIREEHSWVWSRPGEERGCTGCHGDKAVAPDNHWPLTLKRFDTPTPLGEKEHGATTFPAK